MATLTSRERVARALNHEEADRIPIDVGGFHSTALHREGYLRLREHLGLPAASDEEVFMLSAQLVRPDEELSLRFGGDTIGIFDRPPDAWRLEIDPGSDSYKDEWGVELRRSPGSHHYAPVKHPLQGAETQDLDRYPWPNPRDPGRFRGLRDRARELYEKTDKFLVTSCISAMGPVHMTARLTGFEDHFTKMLEDKPFTRAITERMTDFCIAFWDEMLDHIGPYVGAVLIADDLGGQDGPLIGPRLYRELYKSSHARLISSIKSKADVKVIFHSCGSVYHFIQDFIDVGGDALNPVQVSAAHMDTARLKAEFGDRLAFWGGGCDVHKVLPFGTPEEVAREVRMRIAHLAPGGGFVFAPAQNIQPDVPPENVLACYEEALRAGRYPIKAEA